METDWAYENTIDEMPVLINVLSVVQCETVCPQNIEIIDWLAQVHETLAPSINKSNRNALNWYSLIQVPAFVVAMAEKQSNY